MALVGRYPQLEEPDALLNVTLWFVAKGDQEESLNKAGKGKPECCYDFLLQIFGGFSFTEPLSFGSNKKLHGQVIIVKASGRISLFFSTFFTMVMFPSAYACDGVQACISGKLLSNRQAADRQGETSKVIDKGKVVAHSITQVNILEAELSENNHFSLALAPDDTYQISFMLNGHVKRTFELSTSKTTNISFDVTLGGEKLEDNGSLAYFFRENGRYLGKMSLSLRDEFLVSEKAIPKGSYYGWLLWGWQSADALFVSDEQAEHINTFDVYLPKIGDHTANNKLKIPLGGVNQNPEFQVNFQQATVTERAQINASLLMFNQQYQAYYLEKTDPSAYQVFITSLTFDSSQADNFATQYALASVISFTTELHSPAALFALKHYGVEHSFWSINSQLYLKALTLKYKTSEAEPDKETLARALAEIPGEINLFESNSQSKHARFVLEKSLIELAEYQFKPDEVALRFARLAKRYQQYPMFERFNRKYGTENPIAVGRALPGFSLENQDKPGELIENQTLKGKVFLLDAWTSWCVPCRKEVPFYQQAYKKYHDKGFEIFSVNFDTELSAMQAFRTEFSMPWLHHYNGGSLQTDIGKALNVVNFPITILVDENGKVIANGLAIRGKNIDKVLSTFFTGTSTGG